MKIALVTLQGNPFGQTPEAGPDRQDQRLASLVTALAEQDHDVTVYARRDCEGQPEKSEPAPGVTVEHVPAGPARDLPSDSLAPHAAEFGQYLARHWQDGAPDVAHAYFWTSGLAALAGARDLGVPVVQTFLSLQASDPAAAPPVQAQPARAKTRSGNGGGTARLRLEPVIARSVRAVLASSSSEMSALARLGVRRDSVRLIPRGVDTGTFSPEGPVASRGSRPRLLCVAPLAPNQGVDVAVRALADIPEAELVIAGGPEHGKLRGDKAYRALLRLASELNVRDRVIFHGSVSDDRPARAAALRGPAGGRADRRAVRDRRAGGHGLRHAGGGLGDRQSPGHHHRRHHRLAGPAGPPRADRPADPDPAGQPDAAGRVRHRRRGPGPGPVLLGPDRPGDAGHLRAVRGLSRIGPA